MEMLIFIMKTTAVLSLVLFFRVGFSIPLSNENNPERTEKTVQSDSVPIALLLLVPPTVSQFRDDEEDIQDEDFSFIEDHLVNLLLQTAEIPFHEDRVRMGEQNDELDVVSEDLKSLNLLLSNGEAGERNFVAEEPPILNENSDINILTQLREDNKDIKQSFLTEGPLPSSGDENLNSLAHEKDIEVRLVPEESIPSSEDDALSLRDENSVLERKLPIESLPLERSYDVAEYAASYKPTPKPVEQVVATYPAVPNGAIPILLNCAPKVVKGHLADASPSYRSAKGRAELDTRSDVGNSRDVLDLNSPASILTMRRKRHDTGVTHYKVSEDYPETFKGNHHLVSADYPTPNMIRITAHNELS